MKAVNRESLLIMLPFKMKSCARIVTASATKQCCYTGQVFLIKPFSTFVRFSSLPSTKLKEPFSHFLPLLEALFKSEVQRTKNAVEVSKMNIEHSSGIYPRLSVFKKSFK